MAAIYNRNEADTELFELKRTAECLMPGAEARPAAPLAYEHPARAADLVWRGERVGRIFELHPTLLEGRAALLDLDLSLVQRLRPLDKTYTPLRRYPSSHFDLSVIADARELVADLRARLAGFAGELLKSIEFVRQYSGPPLPEHAKSVSFRLTVGSPERTLSSDEVGAVRAKIVEGMRGLDYELRV